MCVCVWFWKYGLVWFGRFGALCLGLDFRMIDQFEEDLVMDIVECVFLNIIWVVLRFEVGFQGNAESGF